MLKFAAISIAALAASTGYAQSPAAAPAAGAPATASVPAPSAGTAPAANPTAPSATAPTATAAPGNPATTAQAAPTPDANASANANANAQVVAVVEAGFPKYDVDKNGQLSEVEFKQWISDLKTQEMAATGKPADPAAVSQYASAALAAADTDKDGVVTKQDLTTFLGG